MDKAKLAAKAMQLTQQMLQEMLVTQDVAKIRAYLAPQGASWIGQNKNAFVPDSNAFAKGYQHKYPGLCLPAFWSRQSGSSFILMSRCASSTASLTCQLPMRAPSPTARALPLRLLLMARTCTFLTCTAHAHGNLCRTKKSIRTSTQHYSLSSWRPSRSQAVCRPLSPPIPPMV